MCGDIHDFYYNTPMVDFEYIKLPLSMFPQEIIYQYNLKYLVAADGYVYMEIRKGMPGIKQAGRLSRDRLNKNLASNGYAPVPHTHRPSSATTRQTSCFPLSSTTLESSTQGRQMPITFSNPSGSITRSPGTGTGRNNSASHSSGTTSTEM